jgi:hypothetical protein
MLQNRQPLLPPFTATFAMIIIAIAVSFLLLENGTHRLIEWTILNDVIPKDLAMTPQSAQALAHCRSAEEPTHSAPAASLPPAARGQAAFMAWKTGFSFGFAVGMANAGLINQAQSAELFLPIRTTSEALRVPSPSPPPFGASATALPDFQHWLEDDQSCTAFELERRYGQSVGHFFKLGAFVGHATIYRAVCPECGALFAPQIQHYGREVRLPIEAWKPYTQKPDGGGSLDDRRQRALKLLETLEAFIKTANDGESS